MSQTIDVDDVRLRTIIRESKWPYWSLGYLTWASWLHIAIRTNVRRYYVYAAVWAIPFFALIVMPEPAPGEQLPSGIAVMVMVMYFGGIIHVFRERRKAVLLLADVPRPVDVKAPVLAPAGPILDEARPTTAEATPLTTPEPNAKRPWSEQWQQFKDDIRVDQRRMKVGLEGGDDWASVAMIPIVPCIEEPDSDDEVTLPWVQRGSFAHVMKIIASLIYDRQLYSVISVFDDYFYVSQTSTITLFIIHHKTHVDLVRRHAKRDIVKLVVAPYRKEKMAYFTLYDSAWTTRKMGDETFRLYVQASTESQSRSRTLIKYVFRVANDASKPEISLNEALSNLNALVPAERRTALAMPSKRRAKITSELRVQARDST